MSPLFASGPRRAHFPEWFAFVYAVLAAALVVVAIEPVPTMAVPVVLTSLPLVFAGRAVRLATLLLLGVFVVLGAMSVGGLFVPAVIALAIAADRARTLAQAA